MNLSEIRTAAQQLGYGTDTATAQTSFIKGRYRRVNGLRRWPWTEEIDTSLATTVSGATTSLASLTSLASIDAVRLNAGTERLDVEAWEYVKVKRAQHADQATGAPQYWAEYDGKIFWYPIPSKVYTVTVEYKNAPVDLAADGDSPVWPAGFHDILVYGCAADLAMRERDWAGNQVYEAAFSKRVNEMASQVFLRQRQTPLTVETDFYDDMGISSA